jgi:RNA polymerase sigma factor (sigma-70 family)
MTASIQQVLRRLGEAEGRELTDEELLDRYRRGREEGAFAALLRRHGGMVWGVCRRLLGQQQDAEDAFQATFFVLARKAGSIGRGNLLGNWLYGVAYRTALKARRSAARWQSRRRPLTVEPAAVGDGGEGADVPALVDEELRQLPEKYRVPVVLCCLEGMTKEEAARSAGWPEGTVSSRLARGRDLLRQRLTRRGVTCSAAPVAALLAGGAAPAAPPALLGAALAAVGPGGTASPSVVALTRGVLHAMWLSQLKTALLSLAACLALVVGGAIGYRVWSGEPAPEPGVPQAQGEGDKPAEVPPSQQWRGEHSAQVKPLRTVLRGAEEWAKVWAVAAIAEVPKKPTPAVDFSKEMVLVAFMGQRNSGGHSIQITRVVRTGDDLTVYVRERAPAPGEAADSVITHPYHLVVVPAVKGRVRFEDDAKKGGGPGRGAAERPQAPKEVKLEQQWRGQQATQEKPLRTAVRTKEEWEKVWKVAEGNVIPMPPAPKVDFERQMVLAAFMGRKPTGGHAITITRVVRTDKGLTAYVRETVPGPGDIVTDALTSPYHFVVVPADKGPVTFENEPEK